MSQVAIQGALAARQVVIPLQAGVHLADTQAAAHQVDTPQEAHQPDIHLALPLAAVTQVATQAATHLALSLEVQLVPLATQAAIHPSLLLAAVTHLVDQAATRLAQLLATHTQLVVTHRPRAFGQLALPQSALAPLLQRARSQSQLALASDARVSQVTTSSAVTTSPATGMMSRQRLATLSSTTGLS